VALLPHMLPSAEVFSRRMSALGLSNGDSIVVYDGSGANLSAARVWWMFRVFGHPDVAVLDGGLGRWKQLGFPLESGEQQLPPGEFTARPDPGGVRSLNDVKRMLGGPVQFVDARSRPRFEGREAEPRTGVRSGHLPGSRSVPYTELVDSEGRLLPAGDLRALFSRAGIDPSRAVVALCGSGTSACAIALALDQLGARDVAVYDGSWTEWGGAADLPIATGPAERLP
ncbi:MAG TPA: rhodanese-like domain-containing protein, partial [Gemmatimonadales bacterium]|nr:rhodanese-like domain-containing protein [Gemmatimonadales bacterium]